MNIAAGTVDISMPATFANDPSVADNVIPILSWNPIPLDTNTVLDVLSFVMRYYKCSIATVHVN